MLEHPRFEVRPASQRINSEVPLFRLTALHLLGQPPRRHLDEGGTPIDKTGIHRRAPLVVPEAHVDPPRVPPFVCSARMQRHAEWRGTDFGVWPRPKTV